MGKTMDELIAERAKLGEAVQTTDQDAFPGSRAYAAASRALSALAVFDRAHPEVLDEIEKRHQARVLGGKDILGL